MGNFQFSVTPAIPTSMSLSVGISPTYPATRLQYPGWPRQVSKTALLSGYWQADLGASIQVDRITLENFNITSVTIAGSNNADMSAPVFSGTMNPGATTEPDSGRRKALWGSGGTVRYVRVTPLAADAGALNYSLGMLGIWRSWQTFGKNVSPYSVEYADDAEVLEMGGGGRQVGLPTPVKLIMTLEGRFYASDSTTLAQWRSLAQVPRNTVFVLYENLSNSTRFWHCRRTASARLAPKEGSTLKMEQVTVEEIV